MDEEIETTSGRVGGISLDCEHRILEKKFIKPNGVCGEYRPNTSKRRLDYPWAEYHSDYLD